MRPCCQAANPPYFHLSICTDWTDTEIVVGCACNDKASPHRIAGSVPETSLFFEFSNLGRADLCSHDRGILPPFAICSRSTPRDRPIRSQCTRNGGVGRRTRGDRSRRLHRGDVSAHRAAAFCDCRGDRGMPPAGIDCRVPPGSGIGKSRDSPAHQLDRLGTPGRDRKAESPCRGFACGCSGAAAIAAVAHPGIPSATHRLRDSAAELIHSKRTQIEDDGPDRGSEA